MNKTQFEVVANVKKFATQASKGGSIVLTLEMPLTDENAILASCQNKDCVAVLKFDNESIETSNGQMELDFSGEAELIKGKKDPDVDYQYIDGFTGEIVNAHLPLEKDLPKEKTAEEIWEQYPDSEDVSDPEEDEVEIEEDPEAEEDNISEFPAEM